MNNQKLNLVYRIFRKFRFLYKKYVLVTFWRILGGQNIKVFGTECVFTPDSSIFEYQNVRVSKNHLLDDIVPYTDYVQLRAVIREAELLDNNPVVIDIGAYHGVYAIVLGKIIQKKGGKLIAVEPHPLQFEILKKNVYLNGLENTVFCEQVAVADSERTAFLRLAGNQSVLNDTKNENNVEITVTTIGHLLTKHNIKSVDLMMIDVEGAELAVLQGVPWDTISNPKIFCEMHPYVWKDFNYTGKDIGRYIEGIGYQCLDMYFQEHNDFPESLYYIGPTLLFRRKYSTARMEE